MAKIYRTATDKRLQRMNQALTRKATYYRKKHGVNLDPPITSPVGLTGSQKNAAIRRGEEYLKKRFVAGAGGAPISRAKAKYFKLIQKRLNEENLAARQSLSGSDPARAFNEVRYGREDSPLRPQTPRMRKPGAYAPRNTAIKDIPSEFALNKLIADIEDRRSPNYKRKIDNRILDTLDKMFLGTDDEDYTAIIRNMTPEQRDYLFNHTSFMDSISFIYRGADDDENDPVIEGQARTQAGKWINLAQQQ